MAEQRLRWLGLPGLMQLPVCLALFCAGFHFDDLNSTVAFLYAFHYIMMAFKAFFRYFLHQDGDEDVYWPIVIINAVTQIILQFWGCKAVSGFLWKNDYNSCEKTLTTVISAMVIVGIEWVLVAIMLVKIFNQLELGARMSKCMKSMSKCMKSTNSRTTRDNNELTEEQVRSLLTANSHDNTDTEKEIDS